MCRAISPDVNLMFTLFAISLPITLCFFSIISTLTLFFATLSNNLSLLPCTASLLIKLTFTPHLTSLHLTLSHFTTLHFTSPHLVSLHFISLHLTSPSHISLHLILSHFTSLHYTLPYLTSLHLILSHSPPLTSGDLLNRGRPLRSMERLRQRLNGLLLQFLDNPQYNPRAADFIQKNM